MEPNDEMLRAAANPYNLEWSHEDIVHVMDVLASNQKTEEFKSFIKYVSQEQKFIFNDIKSYYKDGDQNEIKYTSYFQEPYITIIREIR